MDQVVFDYLNPKVPAGLRLVDVPLVRATAQSIAGYGEIAATRDHRIEIVPAKSLCQPETIATTRL